MLYSGADPELYITEYTLVYEYFLNPDAPTPKILQSQHPNPKP